MKIIEIDAIMVYQSVRPMNETSETSSRNMPHFATPTIFCGAEYHHKGRCNFLMALNPYKLPILLSSIARLFLFIGNDGL